MGAPGSLTFSQILIQMGLARFPLGDVHLRQEQNSVYRLLPRVLHAMQYYATRLHALAAAPTLVLLERCVRLKSWETHTLMQIKGIGVKRLRALQGWVFTCLRAR